MKKRCFHVGHEAHGEGGDDNPTDLNPSGITENNDPATEAHVNESIALSASTDNMEMTTMKCRHVELQREELVFLL